MLCREDSLISNFFYLFYKNNRVTPGFPSCLFKYHQIFQKQNLAKMGNFYLFEISVNGSKSLSPVGLRIIRSVLYIGKCTVDYGVIGDGLKSLGVVRDRFTVYYYQIQNIRYYYMRGWTSKFSVMR